ncbi:MAG: ion transporter [Nitrososphaerota archaeon]
MVSKMEIVGSILAATSIAVILAEYFVVLDFEQLAVLMAADGVIVSVLLADLLYRAKVSGNASGYIRRCWYEVVALLPMALFYYLETQTVIGAMLRGFRLFRIFRLVVTIARTGKTTMHLSEIIRRSGILYLLTISASVVFIGTISAYLLEAGLPESRIKDLGDAFWWALATVTTVGYGDVVPVTVSGRVIGSILMVTGISILGVFISSLGSTLTVTGRSTPSTSSEIKNIVKKKLDILETLSEKELDEIIEVIRMLHKLETTLDQAGEEVGRRSVHPP